MARFRDQAYVLARYPYGERDLVAALLTRRQGQLRGLIRGVRGVRTSRAAAVESLCQVNIEGFQNPGRELATLEDVSLIASSFSLARDPIAWAGGQVVAELALLFCPPGQRSEPSFRLVDRCVQGLIQGVNPVLVAHYAELWFLRLAGVFPDLERCGRCGADLGRSRAWFDGAEGVLVCGVHRKVSDLKTLTLADREWLQRASVLALEQVGRQAPPGAESWLSVLRASFTDRDLRSWKFLATAAGLRGGPPPG